MSEVQENALHRRGVRGLEESERLEDFEMRESLFRGKRADNGEWIEGFLVKKFDKWYIYDFDFLPYSSEITPETAGQYTGLTDKNGKKIFEGDIVKEVSMRFRTMEIEKSIFAVEWCDFDLSYRLIRRFDNGEQTTILTNCGDYEVIGNIHDNPELLQGDK